MTVTLYTLPKCVQCDSTKRYFDRNNISYDVVDLSTNAEAYSMVSEMGFQAAPVVVTDTDKWSGFRIEKLKNLVEAKAS